MRQHETHHHWRRNLTGAALAIALGTGGQAKAWTEAETAMGRENHVQILRQQGGEILNKDLARYVREVGEKIVAQTPLAHEPWTFTVTDTPVVNAFASPGGYVYVTRGFLAVANSEAELAAVIGHEVAHITARHHEARQERGEKAGIGVLIGTILGGIVGGKDGLKKGIELSSKVATGYVSTFSQSQEYEADKIGIEYLASAGYDPTAQASVLSGLSAKQNLEAKRRGQQYNPNRVDFFSSHPDTEDRVRKAARIAKAYAPAQDEGMSEAIYMAAIDGMIYGDSAQQGFVRGKTFIHPDLGFTYSVPESFTITNSAQRIVANGPVRSQFILDGGGPANRDPANYIRHVWTTQIARETEIGTLENLNTYEGDGYRAASASLPFKRGEADWVAHLTVIAHNGRFIRLTGMIPKGRADILSDIQTAALSFRALSAQEAQAAKPFRIDVEAVSEGDRIDSFTRLSPVDPFRDELFMVLNGLKDASDLIPGDLVKTIRE